MTPRISTIGAAIRKVFGEDIGKYPDPYWNNVVLAMKMNSQVDPYWSKVSALLPMDGTTITDAKGKTVTASGSAALSATQSVFGGKSLSLNGTSDYIIMSEHSDFGIGVQDYTIECWIKTSTSGIILDIRNNLVEYGLFYISVGGFLAYDHISGPLVGNISVINNAWHHVVFNRISGVLTMFVDGANSGSFIANANLGSIRQARIGATVAGASFFNGYIDDFRITNGVGRYVAEFTAPKLPCLTGTAQTFLEETGKTVTATNAVTQTSTFKYGNGAAYFDGTGDYLTIPASSDWNFATEDFTIELWYIRNANDGSRVLLQIGDVTNIITLGEYLFAGTTYYNTALIGGGSLSYTSYTVSLGQWIHLALVRHNGFCTVYRNGAVIASGAYSSTLDGTAKPLTIGSNYNQAQPWNGYIDDLRITKGAARYTAAFTPPIREMSNYGTPNSDPYWNAVQIGMHMDGSDNGVAFSDVKGNNVTVTGNVCTKTATKKFGTASAYFDGVGDFLTVGTDKVFTIYTNQDYTLELWFNPTDVSGTHDICGTGGTGITHNLKLVGTQLYFYQWNGGSYWQINGPGTIAVSTWYHVAVAKSGTTTTLYVNGVSYGSYTGNYGYPISALSIGRVTGISGQDFAGYIDDFRYTKGVCRYTSNFSIPTSAFQEVVPASSTLVDPYYDNTFINMHMEGANNGTSFINECGYPASKQGTVITSTTQKKFGATSYYSAGGPNYLYWPVESWQTIGTQDFTIECWVKQDTSSGLCALACNYTSPDGFQWYLNGLQSSIVFAGAGASVTLYQIANNTNWNHFAVSRVAGTLYMFQNGIKLGSGVLSGNITASSLPLRLGYDPSFSLAGYVDEFRFTVGVGRYTSTFIPNSLPNSDYKTAPPAADPYWKNVVLHMPMDGANAGTTFLEKTGKTVTVAGNAQTSTAKYRFGGSSALFDGTNDGVKVATDTSFSIGTGDFTAECWVNATSFTSAPDLISRFDGTSSGWALGLVNDGTVRFSSSAGDNYSSQVLTAGFWYHLSLVRVSGVVKIFCNGTQCLSVNNTSSFSGASEIAIGCRATGTTQSFNGYIDALRITNGVARYTTSFTPPSLPNPTGYDPYAPKVTALLPLSTLTNDTGSSVSLFGSTVLSTTRTKFGTTSTYFDGTGDYLTSTLTSAIGSGDFTVEYFVNYDNISAQKNHFDIGAGWRVYSHSTGGYFRLYANAADRILGTTVVALNTWYHIALVRASGSVKMYVNGVQEGSSYTDSSNLSGTALVVSDPIFAMSGYMQNFRVTNVARYTSAFTPPVEPFALT